MWAVGLVNAGTALNSLAGAGSQTSPGAGTVIASTGAAPATAIYTINWTTIESGTLGAGDATNMGLYINGVLVATGISGTTPTNQPPVTFSVPGGSTIQVRSIAAATVGAVYSATISGTPTYPTLPSGTLTVGVTQERRNK